MEIDNIINLNSHPINNPAFQASCKKMLEEKGVLVLDDFITQLALEAIGLEGIGKKNQAYYTSQDHNIYISDPDLAFEDSHVRNRLVKSSKGCITDDQIDQRSPLRTLYDSKDFQSFLCAVLNEEGLFSYADIWSSINLHYASEGQELGWHFDNSFFATTLLIQKPKAGGVFEYVRDMRDADTGEMNFTGVKEVLDGKTPAKTLIQEPGALALFRGRNALHRVTPTKGNVTRMLVVFAYNNQPGIALSASARKTFYGK